MKAELEAAKRKLRQDARALLRSLSPEERRAGSEAICRRLLEQPVWKQARIVLLFAPFGAEPDIGPALAAALREGKQLCLPKLDPAGFAYHASPVRDVELDLAPGKFGILEPRQTSAAMALNRLDFVLVPGLAFDWYGRRLGRGKGFFDRLLAEVGGSKCGVSFDEQIVAEVPAAEHDICMDFILTPTQWRKTGS